MALGFATRSKSLPSGHRPGRKEAATNSSPRPSTAASTLLEQDVDVEVQKILFSMDYGTKTLSLAYRLAKPGESPSATNVFDIHFSEREYFAPQAAAWAEDGTFYWGYHIERAIKKKQVKREDVIELWKLLLYKDHQSSKIAKEVEAQLGERDVEDLISTHLKEVIAEAKDYIKRSQNLDYSAEDIDNLPMQLFLSVPQMWKAPANLIMTKAAKEAGVDYIELVYEPQCAAAFYTHNVKDRLPKQMNVGDVLLIADIGGGTGDFVSYEYRHDSDAGAKVGLRMVGNAHGALCGSEFVNQNFITWLKVEAGNFKSKCRQLGLTPTACIKQASATFENIKVSFTEPTDESEFVPIRGAQHSMLKVWDVELTSEEIVSFFEPVIEEIINCINKQLTPRTKTLIIPGGFGRSKYLLDRLAAEYKGRLHRIDQATAAVGAYQPVSRGALLRYKDIQSRGVPSKEAFGIAQVEIYDSSLHPDATFSTGDEMPNGRICRKGPIINTAIVETDPYDGEKIVYERWCPIMKKGELKLPGKAFKTETWQQAMVRVGEERIAVQVYWTETNIKEHDPIRQGKDGHSPLMKGIEPWGEELVMELPDLKELGFQPIQSTTKGLVYEIYYRLVMACEGANISVKWQIAHPGTEPYDEDGEHRASQVQLTEDEVFELCDASHNPFPRITPN